MQLKQLYNIATKFSSRKKCYYFWWSTWLLNNRRCHFTVLVAIGHGARYTVPEATAISSNAVNLLYNIRQGKHNNVGPNWKEKV